MQVVTGPEMRTLEKKAFDVLGISPLLAMENAGSRIVETLKGEYGCLASKRVHILVGTGNNGGDGLVVARQLFALGVRVKVYLVGNQQKLTKENRINLEIVRKLGIDSVRVEGSQIGKLKFSLNLADLIIDAVLGTGFSGSLDAELESLANVVNEIQRPIIAIDCPTGVNASTGQVASTAIKADLTISLGLLKVGCLLYPGKSFAGETKVVDLGFPLPSQALTRFYLTADTLNLLPPRAPWGHKGTFGHTLVVAGSLNYAGAAALCGQAVLHGGGGVATVAVPRGIYDRFRPDELIVVPVAQTELGTLGLESLEELLELTKGKNVLALGPGLGRDFGAAPLMQALLNHWEGPAVIDADALLALTSDFLGTVPLAKRKLWVITPHPGEMARLSGRETNQVNDARLDAAAEFAKKWGMVVVLKGAPTIISDGDATHINSTGNHGLGTAGTGDVLTGLIAALLSQGLEPLQAGFTAAYVHGQAGDRAGLKGQRGLTAGDLLPAIQEILC